MKSYVLAITLYATALAPFGFADPIPKMGPLPPVPLKCRDGLKVVTESRISTGGITVLTHEIRRECKAIHVADDGTTYEWSIDSQVTGGKGQIKIHPAIKMFVAKDGKTFSMNGDRKTELMFNEKLKPGEVEKSTRTIQDEEVAVERTRAADERIEFKGRGYPATVIKTVMRFKDRTDEMTAWNVTLEGIDLAYKSVQITGMTVNETILTEFDAKPRPQHDKK